MGAFLCVLWVVLGLAASPALAEVVNPQPAAEDLVLPMPNGGGMVFRPVIVGTGVSPFIQKKFKMGDPDGGFRETPTAVAIGGAFATSSEGTTIWLYYMGKYEIAEAQYYALMELPEGASADLRKSLYPVTNISWQQANEFAHRYNLWLYANAPGAAPQQDHSPGFVRLPTEVEWEFAARGGAAISSDDFDRKHPYTGNLAEYEWFAGPSSSHNKVQPVGTLKPNPLGLHDMLGNVAEMTHSLYQIEYYQGRIGGFVARGGHFLSAEKELRSSSRSEQPFYLADPNKKTVQVNAKPTMGFRLVLSAIVYTSREALQQLASEWDQYRSDQGATLPAAVSVSPVGAQTDVQREDARIHLERLKKALSGVGTLPDSVQQELGLLAASLGEIQFIRKQAEEDSAYAWTKIASEQGFFIFRELRKLPAIEQVLASAEQSGRTAMVEKLRERQEEIQNNIQQSLSTYSESLRQMVTLKQQTVNAGFDKYAQFLREHNAAEQIRALQVVKAHYGVFAKEQRATPDQWRNDFIRLSK